MRRPPFSISLLALALALSGLHATPSVSAQSVGPQYTLELIEPLEGDDSSIAYAISAGGWVTGISLNTGDATNRVVRYRDGEIRDRSKGEPASRGFSINKSAQIAGFFGVATDASSAAVWDGSDVTVLPTLGGPSAQAFGINDAGVVVGGSMAEPGGLFRACKWVDGEAIALPTLDGQSLASAINNEGQIVGSASPDPDPLAPGSHATLWDGDEMIDLGVIDGPTSLGRSINDKGQIVGHTTTTPDGQFGAAGMHAFVWEEGVMTDLGTLPGGTLSHGWDINNHGVVAGSAENPETASDPNIALAAVIWVDGEIINLNDLMPADTGWTLVIAYGINDAGQIVGIARNGVESLGFVLTPAEE